MTIKVGDRLPTVRVKELNAQGLGEISTDALFANKRVLLFGIPAAFSPVCQDDHLPGYVARADELKRQGIQEVVCVAVNDAFVMKAFGKAVGAEGNVTMLADANAEFTRALGMDIDASGFGLGTRSNRYAMIVENGVVKSIQTEASPVEHTVSSADAMLKNLVSA